MANSWTELTFLKQMRIFPRKFNRYGKSQEQKENFQLSHNILKFYNVFRDPINHK